MKKEEIWEGDIPVIRFPRTKEARAKMVPVHNALVDEGFLVFWRQAPEGFLFVGDRPQRAGVARTPAELRASEVAAWIKEKTALEDGVSPTMAGGTRS